MKWLFALFLLANLLFWGYTRLAVPPAPPDWHIREVNADKIRLVPIEPPAPPKPAEPVVEAKPAALEIAAPPAPEILKPASNLLCFNWRGIAATDTERLKQKMTALKLNTQMEIKMPDGPAHYWVYLPPRNTPAETQKKAAEYKRLGVEDFFPVTDGGKWQNAISLGIFSTKEAAERRLAELRDKGVKSAVVREREDGLHTASVSLKGIAPQSRELLENTVKSFRGSALAEDKCQ